MHGSCSEMGSAKVHGMELVEKGAVVLLIICIVSQGTQYFFFIHFKNCLQCQDSAPEPCLNQLLR